MIFSVVPVSGCILMIHCIHFLLQEFLMNTMKMLIIVAEPQLIGHTTINMAVRLIPATIVSTSILGEPVGAIILGILILGEYPVLNEILGAAVILFGIFLVIRYGSQKKAAVKTAEL